MSWTHKCPTCGAESTKDDPEPTINLFDQIVFDIVSMEIDGRMVTIHDATVSAYDFGKFRCTFVYVDELHIEHDKAPATLVFKNENGIKYEIIGEIVSSDTTQGWMNGMFIRFNLKGGFSFQGLLGGDE